MSFFNELRRRNVVKVAAAYAIVGWLLVQIADVFFPALQLPAWTVTFVAALLILGFPVALLLSWAYELTPDGVKRTESVPISESVTALTGRKIDFVIIGLLVAAVAFMFVDNYLPQSGPFAGAAIDPASLAPETGLPAASLPVGEETQRTTRPNSVAVLPFDNLSPDPNDSYFAAGLHEEILNQLAKLQNLSVVSRTSIMRYADSDLSIPDIARELNVGTVMEGSVRYANNRVRITTQLIDAQADEHLWSETYDRDFDDIFAIESDIAMNIANALEAEFSLAEQQKLEEKPTSSSIAYALYLRAITSLMPQAIADLDRAIAVDPEFAEAYGLKALRLAESMRTSDVDEDQWGPVLQQAAERALQLDPDIASAHAALAGLHAANWRWAEAKEAYDRLYELSPNNVEALLAYGNFLRDIGAYDESVSVFERAKALDPSIPNVYNYQLGISYRYQGNIAAAAEIFQTLAVLDPGGTRSLQLGVTRIVAGDREGGAAALQTAEQLWDDGLTTDRIAQLALAYSYADRPDDVERLLAEFERRADQNPVGNAQWAAYHLALREYDQAFERIQAVLADPAGEFRFGQIKANDYKDPVLDEPAWQALRDRLGAWQ